MTKFHLSKVAFTILLLLTSIRLIAEDQSVSYTFGEHLSANTTKSNYPLNERILLTANNKDGGTAPQYYHNTDSTKRSLRIYKSNTFILTPLNGTAIKSVVIESLSASYTPKLSYTIDDETEKKTATASGTRYTISNLTATKRIVFRNNLEATNTQLRMYTITVTYAVLDEGELNDLIDSEGFVGGYTAEQLSPLKTLYADYRQDNTNATIKQNLINEIYTLRKAPQITFDAGRFYRITNVADNNVLYADYSNSNVASRPDSDASQVSEFWKVTSVNGETTITNPNTKTAIADASGNLTSAGTGNITNTGVAKYKIAFGTESLTVAPEIRLKSIESIDVNILGGRYGTFYFPFAVNASADAAFYRGEAERSDAYHVRKTEGPIPAETPIVVASTEAKVSLAIAYDSTLPSNNQVTETGVLRGSLAPLPLPAGAYVLWTGTQGVAFYPVASNNTLTANKVYFQTALGASVRPIEVGEAPTTSIAPVVDEKQNTTYFHLNGRPVTRPVAGAIYLTKDGKKVIFK